MIIYNVTIHVQWSIHDDWLQWMKTEHIADVLSTGMFFDHRVLRLLEIDETDGPTYAVQYYAEDREHYNQYISGFATEMRKKGADKWGENIIAFRSVMQVVD